jgi:hypothetical protein
MTLEWHLRLKQSGGAHPELHEHVLRPTHVPPPLKMLQSPTPVQVAMTKFSEISLTSIGALLGHSGVTYGYYNLHLSSQWNSYNGREHHTRHVRNSYLIAGNQLRDPKTFLTIAHVTDSHHIPFKQSGGKNPSWHLQVFEATQVPRPLHSFTPEQETTTIATLVPFL